jgi:hypothetical protein
LAIPQKSPIFAQSASAESFEAALVLDSSAWAANPDSSSAAPAATAVLIPIASLNGFLRFCSIEEQGRQDGPDART